MRLHNHSDNDISHVLIDVHHDPNFDTVDIDMNVSDLDINDYEALMIEVVRLFKKYGVTVVRD